MVQNFNVDLLRDAFYFEPQVKQDASDATYLANLCINKTSVNPLCAVPLALTLFSMSG